MDQKEDTVSAGRMVIVRSIKQTGGCHSEKKGRVGVCDGPAERQSG